MRNTSAYVATTAACNPSATDAAIADGVKNEWFMKQDNTTYYIWIGGSCDYGRKERAGAAAAIVQHGGTITKNEVIADLFTTEFRMMLTLMTKVMRELPEGSDVLFLTNVAYLQNFCKAPAAKTANADLVLQCIEQKQRHESADVKVVAYHKSPLLIETHDASTEAMKRLREDYRHQKRQKSFSPSLERVIHMEQLHDLVRADVDSADKGRLAKHAKEMQALQAYYEGGEWMADFDADRHGFFPKDLKRGILAEDTLDDLFCDIEQL